MIRITTKSVGEFFGAMILAVPVVTFLIALQLALRGWALTYLWAWFVVPMFKLPPLSVPYALGLCLVGGILASGFGSSRRIADEYSTNNNWKPFIQPFLVVAMGWVITKFM